MTSQALSAIAAKLVIIGCLTDYVKSATSVNFSSTCSGVNTIVGSAAFNMLVISAVCVVAIPDGAGRHIKELPVFYITAAFSLAAYLWLIVILQWNTPNIVDVWEGVVTLLAFPALVYIAYLADIADEDTNGPEDAEAETPEAKSATAAVGYGKDGRPISRITYQY